MPSSVVPKPWGWEYCAFDNGAAAIWILHIARGRQTSKHCHPNKRTRLVLLQGEVRYNGAPVSPLDVIDIPAGTYHQTACTCECVPASENGAFVMEIEEPSAKGDIIRADDAYGRAGAPIEAATLPFSGEMLEITAKESKAMGYGFKIETTLGGDTPDIMLDVGGEVLGIYRDRLKKVSDCVADFVRALGIRHVFGVTGGGSMHLNDSFREFFHANHHEQASAMAADAYARVSGLGCALVTTGPGGTNATTGVACAWVDSTPVLFLSGQVTTNTLMAGTGMRQFGIQESDIVALVNPITKYAVTVTDAKDIRYELERAVWFATTGRPGPVWVDIPLDIQGTSVKWEELRRWEAPKVFRQDFVFQLEATLDALQNAIRPVLVYGNGVHLSHAEEEARMLAAHLGIPVLTSWAAGDVMADDASHIGHFGIFGDRASNFAIQNADLILCIGSRLSVAQTGYNTKHFARAAKIIMVDVDEAELMRRHMKIHMKIEADAKDFINALLAWKWPHLNAHGLWLEWCRKCRDEYPVLDENKDTGQAVNSFHFIDALSKSLPDDAIVVTDMGTAFTCTFQAAKMRKGQRWLTASGHAPMGYGLPGAIGAHYASGKPVVCIVGDGALMFNLQELQTIAENRLPIRVIVLDNGGYLAMKHTQMNHFGRLVGADFKFPDWTALFALFGLSVEVVKMDPMQPLLPRSSSMKLPNGQIASKPIEDLYPFLPRDEFRRHMIVPTVEELG